MKFTEKDFTEAKQLAKVQIKIDKIDAKYVNEISDELLKKQPFFLAVLLSYRFDVTPLELEEIMKIYFLIWEYFRTNKKVQSEKVTQDRFEMIENKIISMLQYSEGEANENDKINIYAADWGNLKSKALFTAILFRYNQRPVLLKMEERQRGLILIGIKSFIQCFETI